MSEEVTMNTEEVEAKNNAEKFLKTLKENEPTTKAELVTEYEDGLQLLYIQSSKDLDDTRKVLIGKWEDGSQKAGTVQEILHLDLGLLPRQQTN